MSGSKRLREGLTYFRLTGIMLVLLGIVACTSRSFFNQANLINIISHASINGILAVGMTALMISKAFDISIGSIMVLAGVISILLLQYLSPALAMTIAICSGLFLGLVNGILVAWLNINSFIATLGTMVVFQGIAFALTDMKPVTTESTAYQVLGNGEMLGLPAPVFYFILAILIIWAMMRFTPLGKNAYAIGGNEDACRMMGIPVRFYLTIYFMISGLAGSFAGVVLSSKISAASAVFGENVALVVIAAIVLGGVHLTGGVGTIGGVVQAIFLLGLLENITVYLGLFGYWQLFFRSAILIAVVVFDALYSKYALSKLQIQELFKLKTTGNSV